jgi:hypothetical protein
MVLTGTLDLFELMVNYVAGSIILSLFLWVLILLVTGIMGRLSMKSILVILSTFLLVAAVGYIGALAAVPLMLWALWYMITGVIRAINSM